MTAPETVNVRCLVDDVAACVDFYTKHFGFTVGISSPAFADVTSGNLRLLLSDPNSSAGQTMSDGERPGPGGWNRNHLIVENLDAEIARLTDEGVGFRPKISSTTPPSFLIGNLIRCAVQRDRSCRESGTRARGNNQGCLSVPGNQSDLDA